MKLSFLKVSFFSFLFVLVGLLQSCGDTDDLKTEITINIERPIGSELDVFWNLVENGFEGKSSYLSEFMISNNSTKTLDSSGWAIYFHQPRRVISESTSKNIKITHILLL